MKKKIKYYHASRRLDWKPGDIIASQNDNCLWMTTSPKVHWTLYSMPDGQNIGECRYNVYRVIPHGKIFQGMWNDLICQGYLEVVECLGEVNKNRTVSRTERRGKTVEFKKRIWEC